MTKKEEIMSCYCGITTDPKGRRKQHEASHPGLYSWEQRPFSSREAAQIWENQQTHCEHHPGGREPNDQNAAWYGYKFYF